MLSLALELASASQTRSFAGGHMIVIANLGQAHHTQVITSISLVTVYTSQTLVKQHQSNNKQANNQSHRGQDEAHHGPPSFVPSKRWVAKGEFLFSYPTCVFILLHFDCLFSHALTPSYLY